MKYSNFTFFPLIFDYHRYGQVIAVIGMNPSKTYQVSPFERAQLLQKLIDSGSQPLINVRVQGTVMSIMRKSHV